MMNDLDICTKIAEIEGAKETLYSRVNPKELTAIFDNNTHFDYNPLTDDALCLRLIEKYGVKFNFYYDLDGVKWYYGDVWVSGVKIIPHTKDLKRFICLYVIELNKGK